MQIVDRLRIAHVVFSFDYGGLERRILRLIDGLSPDGADFTIVSLRPSDGRFLPDRPNVRHLVLDARPGLDMRAVGRLKRILTAEAVHVVHSHNWVSMLEGIVAGRLAGVPAVVHGEHGASRFEAGQLKFKRTLVQATLARTAHALVPVNEAIRDRMCEVWHIDPARCAVIRNGVDTARFSPCEREPGGTITIGSISRLEPIKNFPCLIRAVHELNQSTESPRYKLVIVGEGGERKALQTMIGDLGCEAYVSLPGATDAPDTWYGQFDIYVNCSFSEGMSNTVLEAMACGTPVVVSDVAGHRDWLEERHNALFFPSNDVAGLAAALRELADDSALRSRMRQNNRSHVVENFSFNRFVNDYRRLYQRLLLNRGISWQANTDPAPAPNA